MTPLQSNGQVQQLASLPLGKPTASWPSSVPVRQLSVGSRVGQPLAPASARDGASTVSTWPVASNGREVCDWAMELTTPRSVHFSDAGSQSNVEVQRQSSVTRHLALAPHTSSLERLANLGSRECSPERALSSERDTSFHDTLRDVPLEPKGRLSAGGGGSSSTSNLHGGSRSGAASRVKPGGGGGASTANLLSLQQTSNAQGGGAPGRPARASKKELGSRGRVVSPRSKRAAGGARQPPALAGSEEGQSSALVQSPREDRVVTRTNSQGALTRAADREELSTLIALRRELEDTRHDNCRLQERLCKARSQMLLLQRQADEARAERDREHRRAEGLQVTTQQLQRQLRRETAKANLLERTLAAATKNGDPVAIQGAGGGSREESSPAGPSASARQAGAPVSPRDVRPEPQNRAPVRRVEAPVPQSNDMSSASAPAEDDEFEAREMRLIAEELRNETMAERAPDEAASGSTAAPPPAGALSLEKSWEFVVQGQHDPVDQPEFAPKLVSCFPDDAVERASSRGVACVCSRGRRLDASGHPSSVPNQDDFLIARHTLAHEGHIALYGVFDGHGHDGHHCAAFARGSLPESLFGQPTLLMKPEDTLRQAFQRTQASLLQQSFDTENSGTTAALALVLDIPSPPVASTQESAGLENDGSTESSSAEPASEHRHSETWLFVAHVGDSRVILASHLNDEPSSFSVTELTRDHRADKPEEAERIQREGGEVRKLHRNSGQRVFARGQDRPALALTRSLGASAAVDCGVTAEPEVSAYQLRPGVDALLLLGTDGFHEFCNHEEAVGRILRDGASAQVLEELCVESRQHWAQSSYNETVDDITAIAVALPSKTGFTRESA